MNTYAAGRLIVVDLDDTLYREADFVDSARRAIARLTGADIDPDEPFDRWLDRVAATTGRPVASLLEIYRTHMPDIRPLPGVIEALRRLHADPATRLLLLTRGRTLTQTNKITALGIAPYLSEPPVIIPATASKEPEFVRLDRLYDSLEKYSVGDNPDTDLLAPRRLGWHTVAVADDGRNIHPQHFTPDNRPDLIVDTLAAIF